MPDLSLVVFEISLDFQGECVNVHDLVRSGDEETIPHGCDLYRESEKRAPDGLTIAASNHVGITAEDLALVGVEGCCSVHFLDNIEERALPSHEKWSVSMQQLLVRLYPTEPGKLVSAPGHLRPTNKRA